MGTKGVDDANAKQSEVVEQKGMRSMNGRLATHLVCTRETSNYSFRFLSVMEAVQKEAWYLGRPLINVKDGISRESSIYSWHYSQHCLSSFGALGVPKLSIFRGNCVLNRNFADYGSMLCHHASCTIDPATEL